ncbi:pyridoxamine 5'-phosphate oxidase family protein [Cellulomonas sp.]|uniref:pyridoxamine 5'-phosphate oxidase family protein n=1 Tax=Cellulomonas sp. TaxID=40001 RepID=UPI002582F716|nr:pyridoxamine 5'-phosphate oxidase family protein [Cellulomonas sp.]MCR6688283.1 pyridoxamine 5-phosphate oxidase [Cellulomonas sp.]
MARWRDVEREAPDLAALVRAVFGAGTNKTMATLRADGSPRISGTELAFGEQDVTLGMMPGSVKLRDVLRDPRVAVHSPTLEPPADPTQWVGDAKLAGRLVEAPRPEDGPPGAYFALDVTEVVHTRVDPSGEALVVTSWHPGRGVTRVERT